LRTEIGRIYETVQPADVLVHTGAEEAIFLFMHAALKADDHVIVHAPHYQSLSEAARSIGCSVSLWKAREENGWALNLDELPRLTRPATKAIIVNTPHNPTGYLMSRADFDLLHRFARENNLILFPMRSTANRSTTPHPVCLPRATWAIMPSRSESHPRRMDSQVSASDGSPRITAPSTSAWPR
jgi:hypothetical protein